MRLLLFERTRAAHKAVVRADEADVRAEKGEARAEEARGKAEEARRSPQEAAWRADDADVRAADMERIVAEEVARRLRAESGEAVARREADDLAERLGRMPCPEQLEADAAVAKIRAGVLETELAELRGSLVEKVEEVASVREEEASARRRKAEARVAVLEFVRAEEVTLREKAESAAARAEARADELAKEMEERTVPTERINRLHDLSSENVISGQSDREGVTRVSTSEPHDQMGGGSPIKQRPQYKPMLSDPENQCSQCKKKWSSRWYAPLEDTFRLLCRACYNKERNASR